jgi:ABC-type nitrate/sulfonate/bicarbonate transport system substrate-binding protein
MSHAANRSGRLGVATGLLTLLLVACAPAAAPSPSGAKPAQPAAPAAAASPAPAAAAKPATLTKVTQALPVHSFGYLPLYVALERGFFREEGLEVETPIMASSSAVAGLVNGDVDLATAGTGVRAAMQGAPLKSILYSYNVTLFELVAAPDIQRIEDLRGKILGTSSPGSTEEISASIMLRQAGLDPSTDVTFLIVPAGNQLPTLVAGAVQAMMVNPDLSAMAQDHGLRVLRTVEDVGRVMPQPFAGFAVAADTLQKRPDVVRAYIRAYLKAIQYVKNSPRETAAITAKVLDMEPRIADIAVPKSAQAINLDDVGGATQEGLQLEIDNNLRALRDQAKVTQLNELVDLTLLRQVQREMGIPCKSGYQCR